MLPNPSITPIPNNEPDAVPSLWNVRYQEIDENFDNLDSRTEAIESEIEAARAGKPNLSETINAIVTQIGGISGTLNGLASPTSVQNAVTLDWLYRNVQGQALALVDIKVLDHFIVADTAVMSFAERGLI